MDKTAQLPLMERLRNLEKGYSRRSALLFLADEVWKTLEEHEQAKG